MGEEYGQLKREGNESHRVSNALSVCLAPASLSVSFWPWTNIHATLNSLNIFYRRVG